MQRKIGAGVLLAVAIACGGGDPVSSTTVAAVQITTAAATLRVGQTSQFSAAPVNARGEIITGAGAATWSSSVPAVATVDAGGLVTALTTGTTNITATVNGVSGNRVVTVLGAGVGAIVTMPGNSFIPFEVTIRTGEQVYFEFPQVPHNVIFDRKSGAPSDIQQTHNVTIARTFSVAGRFDYACTLHPGMVGLVTVTQ